VRFNGVAAGFSVQSSTRITATVPPGATSGRISVTASSHTATSSGSFTVTGGSGAHERTISLGLSGHLIASGNVVANDGYQACASNVPVVIKRYRHGRWHWVTTTATRADGGYRTFVRNRRGRYRAHAKRITLVNGEICGKDLSNPVAYNG